MIAFLHTAESNKHKFEKLVRAHSADLIVKHYVNEKLLEYAISNGITDSATFKSQVEEIKKETPSIIICTCSSYGNECDNTIGIERIDKPIVKHIVKNYHRIGLAFAAKSTYQVSKDLLLSTSIRLEKEIEIIDCDCSEYWDDFQNGNLTDYEQGIASNIKILESKVDVILLAQASMEGAKKRL